MAAKQYYSAEEARAKLKTDDDGLKLLVRQGKLREFRDAGRLNYRVEEVDAIVAERSSGLTGSGEFLLEPAEDTGTRTPAAGLSSSGSTAGGTRLPGESSIFNLEDTTTPEKPAAKTGSGGAIKASDSSLGLSGSDVLSLEEVDKETVEGMRKDDTVITNVGISVFDDDDLEIASADPAAKTIATGSGAHLGLDGSAAGSGLLDLTRESDDTSLGADVLEDIGDGATQTTEATATTDMGEAPVAEVSAGEPVGVAAGPRLVTIAAFPEDPSSPIFAGLLVACMLVMAIVGASTAAMTLNVWPSYLDLLYQNLLVFAGATVVAGGLFALIGWLIGRQPTARPDKPKKVKAKGKAKAGAEAVG